jgi:tRNA modification GTPase
MHEQDTIAAIATPPGEGAVAIVRLSGPDAERIATEIFMRGEGKNSRLVSHRLYHGKIKDPASGKIFDEVLLAIMRQPRSYTGEDVVELHCHGGVFVVRRLLELVLSRGARHAEAGEFTKRAFVNGRMDLAQAEAVLDIIRARTEKGVELAVGQASGELSKWVVELREDLLAILVQVEAAIDFPEEEIELLQHFELVGKVDALCSKMAHIIATYDWGRLLRNGARVCICGRPNVGKSSLLNALLGENRVIVTPLPGTTRDVIEEAVNLDGLAVALWDTAGIRATDDQVEKLGVELSLSHLQKADAVIVVLDQSAALTDDDYACLHATMSKKRLVVLNKSDLRAVVKSSMLDSVSAEREVLNVSATAGTGLDELRRSLRNLLLQSEVQAEPAIVLTNLRHKAALTAGREALSRAADALRVRHAAEFVAVNLQEAKERLEEIVGTVTSDDILERIFSQFCIGK